MSLINHLFFAMLTSSVTSTFLLLVWWMLRGFFMLVNPRMVYTTLRWVGFSFLLPIGYISIFLSYRGWMEGKDDNIWKVVFRRTDMIEDIMHTVSIGWFIVALVLFIYRLIDNWVWCRKLRDNIPIEKDIEPEVVEKFEEACTVLGIQLNEVSLQRNVTVDMPMIIGNKHPQVILPEQDYTADELEIIFYHELSHYKHKDLRCKLVAVIAVTLHCFSLGCYLYLFLVNLWSEFMADASALEASGHLHDSQNYFNKIVNLVSGSKSTRERFLFSALSRENKSLARRIDFMKKYQKAKSAGKVVTAAITTAFVLLSTTSIYASGKVVTDLHNIIYQNTEDRTKEGTKEPEKLVVTDDGYVEHYVDVEDLNFEGMQEVSTLEQDIVSLASGVHYNIDWEVRPNTRHVGKYYEVKKGQTIGAAVMVVPADKDYWLGIMREGHARYIEARGASSHNFVIDTTDEWCVFVQNNYKKDVYLDAKGYFEYE